MSITTQSLFYLFIIMSLIIIIYHSTMSSYTSVFAVSYFKVLVFGCFFGFGFDFKVLVFGCFFGVGVQSSSSELPSESSSVHATCFLLIERRLEGGDSFPLSLSTPILRGTGVILFDDDFLPVRDMVIGSDGRSDGRTGLLDASPCCFALGFKGCGCCPPGFRDGS